MPVARLSSIATEALAAPAPVGRVAHEAVEVLAAMPTASPTTVTGGGVSQHAVEVLLAAPSASAMVAHDAIEVLMTAAGVFEGGAPTGGAQTLSFGIAV